MAAVQSVVVIFMTLLGKEMEHISKIHSEISLMPNAPETLGWENDIVCTGLRGLVSSEMCSIKGKDALFGKLNQNCEQIN